jgi:hypothetical protein
MATRPNWLPDVEPISGDITAVIGRLYAIFHRDVKLGHLLLRQLDVWWDRRPREVFGLTYEEGFWHLVSRDCEVWTATGRSWRRDFDPPRAERLPWFAPTVGHVDAAEVTIWDYLEADRKVSTYIWLKDWDYLILLRKRPQRRGDIYFLTTAYHVDGPASRAKLQRKYERRCA